ncbi:LPXTG cell wall anchor domain-containing protein, partial [Dietzia sp. CQ4]|nr:LPXTG cell wall anchor domain-containing protein [Dietzia sp. CQ4]
ARAQASGPATLAATGVETTAIAGLATVSLLLGALLLAGSRRRG